MSQAKKPAVEAEETSEVSFVSRWSRLKHDAAKDAGAGVTENITSNTAAAENSEPEIKQASSTGILTDEDMPDIESLTPDSDYADFLSPGVSDELRKLALRKLFHGEAFNIRDGLDEYDGDYTQFEKLGDIVTSDMRHQIELEAQRKAEQLLQDQDPLRDDGCIDDVAMDSNDKESDDEDTDIALSTAGNSASVDESQTLTKAETMAETEAETDNGQKAYLQSE